MFGILIAAALAVVATGPGPETRPSDSGAMWRWTAQPDHADVWKAMRDAGLGQPDIGHYAVVECTIGEDRRLKDCEVVETSERGQDVGRAILYLTWRYRAATVDAKGQPTPGRKVELGMGYGGTIVP